MSSIRIEMRRKLRNSTACPLCTNSKEWFLRNGESPSGSYWSITTSNRWSSWRAISRPWMRITLPIIPAKSQKEMKKKAILKIASIENWNYSLACLMIKESRKLYGVLWRICPSQTSSSLGYCRLMIS